MEDLVIRIVMIFLGAILSLLTGLTLYMVRKTAASNDQRLSAIENTQSEHIKALQILTERLLKDYPDKEDCDRKHSYCDRSFSDHESRIRTLERNQATLPT